MVLNNVTTNQNDGGLGRRAPLTDMIKGLITNAISVVGGIQNDTTYELKSLEDLAALLVDAAYDVTNRVLVHHKVKEFFRMNPSGTLWLRTTAQATTMTAMADVTNDHALQLLKDANGQVKVLGIALDPATGYVPTLTGGLDGDVLTAVPKAQALADAEFASHRPVQIVLEGRSFNGTATAATDLRTLDAQNVSVCIGMDKEVVNLIGPATGSAAIGTLLGTLSRAKSNESIAWVEKFDVQSVAAGRMLVPYLSSESLVSSYSETDQDTLNAKGYIFPRTFVGLAGVYWNDSHTCKAVTSDFSYIENNRISHKAARLIRSKMLPKLNSPVNVDATTGQLDAVTVEYFQGLGDEALRPMVQDLEVSGAAAFMDPSQNILSTSQLVIRYEITPTGTARNIVNEIAFNNPF